MTAQLAVTRVHQAIPIPVYTGQTLTAFTVCIRLEISMIAENENASCQAGTYDSKVWALAGDSYGVIHAFDPSPISDCLSVPDHTFQHSWNREYQLDSRVGPYEQTG